MTSGIPMQIMDEVGVYHVVSVWWIMAETSVLRYRLALKECISIRIPNVYHNVRITNDTILWPINVKKYAVPPKNLTKILDCVSNVLPDFRVMSMMPIVAKRFLFKKKHANRDMT